ncbi:unnamed protein product [Effrenium voratum]|nr:unnamed protein product [Effrenium voratum]
MSLRRTCRELVLEVVLPRVQKSVGDGLDRFQMVVDAATLRVINSFLRMGDLHTEGVTSVELLEEDREPLPGLDALYFLRPLPATLDLILADFKSAAAPQHRQVEQSLLSRLTEATHLAGRVRSFVEVPLSFLLVQDRGFHFDMPEAITGLFPVPDPQMLSDIVQKLTDVCRCLQTTSPIIRCQSDLCHTVADRVLRELNMHKQPSLPSQPCQLIILDRSLDMAAALVHEYSYEACVFDLLDGNMLDADRNIVTMETSGETREVLLSDPLWEELRYMHLEAAREHVEAKVDEVKRQNARGGNGMSTKVMLEQLRSAPEMRDAVDRMSLHLSIIKQIHARLGQEQILDPLHLGLVEQDIACGIDKNGKDVKITNLQTTLQRILTDRPELPSEMKLRLLMLYFACVANIPEANRSKLMEAARLAPEDHQVLMSMLGTRLMAPESQRKQGTGCAHRVTKQQAARSKKNATAEGRFELSRFEPCLKELLERLAEDRLSFEEFPVCQNSGDDFGLREAGYATAEALGAPAIQAKDDWSFASGGEEREKAEVSHRIVVFVLGGFTHSELRAAAEVRLAKLGLSFWDAEAPGPVFAVWEAAQLCDGLLQLMEASAADWTLTWRKLADVAEASTGLHPVSPKPILCTKGLPVLDSFHHLELWRSLKCKANETIMQMLVREEETEENRTKSQGAEAKKSKFGFTCGMDIRGQGRRGHRHWSYAAGVGNQLDDADGLRGFYEPLTPQMEQQWERWLQRWLQRLQAEAMDAEEVAQTMREASPKYVPRNWMLMEAYEAAEAGSFQVAQQLQERWEHPELESRYFRLAPPELRGRPGVYIMT